MDTIKKGVYRHYKGGEYLVTGLATNTETGESLVIYQDIKTKTTYCRPQEMFQGQVELKKKKKARFTLINEEAEQDWQDKYLRTLADFHNFRKQEEKDRAKFAKYANEDFLHELLPVYDYLKLSLQGLDEKEKNNPWAIGVSHVLKQFKDLLSSHGVEEIKTIGEKFDHHTMDAVEGEGEIVSQEVKPGYRLFDKVIRPAKVIVKKAN